MPGKTLCVCQSGNQLTTHSGYLNSLVVDDAGDKTVNLICAFPVFTPGLGVGYCPTFQVIK